MKRRDLLRHLEQRGCALDREGGWHSIYHNPRNKRSVAVPRHREIIDSLTTLDFREIELRARFTTIYYAPTAHCPLAFLLLFR
jgi:predicted RNA binding protein YcfA (HicA-like mRNA interferase family)